MDNQKREEIRARLSKPMPIFVASEVGTLLDALDLAESHLSKARETLGKYADEAEWKTCDIDIGCNVKHCFGKSGQHGYEPAQKCLAEIGGEDA